jgi:molybdate transport system substrate-binding protein
VTVTLHILSGGAAQGLVQRIEPLASAEGLDISGTFGAVGAMKDKFAAGSPCDVIILTEALIRGMVDAGQVDKETHAALGGVPTGVAVLEGAALPDVNTAAGLRAAVTQASGIYFPDPEKATAGIHFAKVLRSLGLYEELAPRLRPFPNGATAMREMAKTGDKRTLGCTQMTEIVITPGIRLVGPLPKEFELVTVYSVAVSERAANPTQARRLAQMLASPQASSIRSACGFV